MNIKKQQQIYGWITVVIRGVFFFFFPALFSTAFAGVKYIIGQMSQHQPLQMNAFLWTLFALLAFTILFGRYFCGFACAFGTYGDALYFFTSKIRLMLRKKRKKRGPLQVPVSESLGNKLRYGKYVMLLLMSLLCFVGASNFIAENSPWTLFSQLQSLKLPSNTTGLAVFSLLLISIGMMFVPRFFCRFLCPMGALFSILPIMPFSTVTREKENCLKGCNLCQRNCPAGLSLADKNSQERIHMGECFNCSKCAYGCPKTNASAITMPGGKPGFIWTIGKALLLLGVAVLLNTIG